LFFFYPPNADTVWGRWQPCDCQGKVWASVRAFMHACMRVYVCVFVRARVRTCVTTLLQEGASQESEIPLRQDCSFSLGLRVSGARLLL